MRNYGNVAFMLFDLERFYYYSHVLEGGVFMKHKVYTVYDSKAEVYMQPIFMRADGEAIRAFSASIAQNGHQFATNPGDYTLFAIGEYDDDKGRFVQYDAFVNLGNGVQFIPEVK